MTSPQTLPGKPKPLYPKPEFCDAGLILVTLLICGFYTLMEWLFIITKPSSLVYTTFGGKLAILVVSASLLSLCGLVLLIPFIILFQSAKKARSLEITRWTAILIPTLLLACLVLLLIDNFTYTVLKFGIITSDGFQRAAYILVLLGAGFYFYPKVIEVANLAEVVFKRLSGNLRTILTVLLMVAILVSVLVPISIASSRKIENAGIVQDGTTSKKPDILLITADAVNTSHVSFYEYEWETTPFLGSLAAESLVAWNHYSNAQGTIGSITSILTGKYPTQNRVLHTTDRLTGSDAFQHLPGVLRANGYYTIQLNYSYYADASRANLQDAFDFANGTSLDSPSGFDTLLGSLPDSHAYFLREASSRLVDRLLHIFFIREMGNPYLQVTETPKKFNDQQKIDQAIEMLAEIEQPVFLHLHWMGTHGPAYHPEDRVFSI